MCDDVGSTDIRSERLRAVAIGVRPMIVAVRKRQADAR